MNVGAETSVGRVRRTNEDAFWTGDRVLIVCDGMGGHRAGEVASAMAVEAIRSFPFRFQDPEAEVREAILQAHARIAQASAANAEMAGMGTTVTMAVCLETDSGADVTVGHVGDSRAYYYADGQLYRITNDHSVVGELTRQGTLSPEEAVLHPQRHVLCQALGISEVEVELHRLMLPFGSLIVICTDGLTDVLADDQIKEHVACFPPQEAARRLVELANSLGGRDNVTVIVAQVP